ncbi:hypothetical protein ONZ51_g5247 [Trametes cubensis]|uniref:Uncharacterized protein n=1 Tax=Trametes cubensis TaxID=1111947 RepID=A0AAD7TWV2_9APHY|nr:hypothetical protein ONZ51_g5247 [Trametes cubensis]
MSYNFQSSSISVYEALSRAGPELASIINDNIRTLYQLQLGLAGMMNGPEGDDSKGLLYERLEALCAFTTAWESGEHPVHEITLASSQQSGHSMWHYIPPRIALDVSCIDKQAGSLIIHRPPGVLSGISGNEYTYEGLAARINLRSITGFHVDLAQDLFIWCDGITNTPRPSLHFCSLSNHFGPHHDAARPTISSCFPTYMEWFPFLEIQVFGDIVAWSMYGGDTGDQATDLLIINWKTGVVIMHMHFPNDRIYVMLISRTQLCALHCDTMSIYLYTLNPCASADSKVTTFEDSFAVLRLPACHDRVVRKVVYGDIGFPPAYPDGTSYHFRHDPTHSLLVVTINLDYALDDAESDPEHRPTGTERFLLFIPVGTLLREYHFADPHDQYATAFPPGVIQGSGSEPHRTIPWERWGPSGTRMISLQSARSDLESDINAPPSILGAHVALIAYRPSDEQYVATIYEVHPLADATAPLPMAKAESTVVELGKEAHRQRSEGDYIRGSKTWKDDIHTTFPYKTTTRILPHCDVDGRPRYMDQRNILLTHDGLVHIKNDE